MRWIDDLSQGRPVPDDDTAQKPTGRKTVHDLVREAKACIEELDVADLKRELAASDGSSCRVIDIRDFRERIANGSIPGSISAPRGMLEFWFDPESPYYRDGYGFADRFVFFCASGWRSALATKVIAEIGYTNVAHLAPGFSGWVDAGESVEDVAESSKWVKRT